MFVSEGVLCSPGHLKLPVRYPASDDAIEDLELKDLELGWRHYPHSCQAVSKSTNSVLSLWIH